MGKLPHTIFRSREYYMSYIRFLFISCAVALLVVINSCNDSSTTTNPSQNPADSPVAVEENVIEDAATKDKEFMTALGLMKGHLMVGKELLDQKLAEQAEPHMAHPIEEIYGDIETELSERNIDDFKPELNQLHDVVATAPDAAEIPAQYEQVMGSIDNAIAALPAEKLQSPKFVLDSINGLLAAANEEYAAGILDGKVVEIIEYQDSRGFVNNVDLMYQTIATKMQQQSPDLHQTIASSIEELKKAWPSATAPEQVAVAPEQVDKLVTQIKQSSEAI